MGNIDPFLLIQRDGAITNAVGLVADVLKSTATNLGASKLTIAIGIVPIFANGFQNAAIHTNA
jgi:hypothetical protein